MIDPHVHCGICGCEIATKIKCAGGKTKDAEIAAGTQFRPWPGPEGMILVPFQVAICKDCEQKGRESQEKAKAEQAASKIIVPRLDTSRLGIRQ